MRELAGPELIRGVERWAIRLYGELARSRWRRVRRTGTEQLVRQLRAMKPGLLWQRLIGAESAPNSGDALDAAPSTERSRETLPRAPRSSPMSGGNATARQSMERLFATRPELVQAEIAAIVETWARRVFPAFAEAALALIGRDVEAKERLFAERLGARRGHRGHDERRGASTRTARRPRSSSIPTVALRPFIVPVEWRSTSIILCSVADEAFDDDPAAPPRRLVQAAAALGDALRLRVLHELGAAELTASELADRLGVDRTSLHHHLGILRSAGLVTVRADGLQCWHYAARGDGIAGTAAALTGYLGRR